MRKRLILAALFMVSVLNEACAQQSFRKISRQAAHSAEDKTARYKVYTFSEIRDKLYKDNNNKTSFLREVFTKDTLYMMESFVIEGKAYFGRIWNGRSAVEYKYEEGHFTYFDRLPFFDAYSIDNIQRWDTSRIKAESEKYGNVIVGSSLYATRIIVDGKKIRVNTITFLPYSKD
jgi:hypothetical protein